MSRGGNHNPNGSPLMSDNAITATTQELSALTANMRENFIADLQRPPIDLHNPLEVKQAIIDYLLDCEQSGKRPGNMGLYRALDMSRQDMNNILTGKSKTRASLECIDIIKKALNMLSEYREQLGLQGKLNPVSLIFWQKNYDGLRDTQELEVVAKPSHIPDMTPDEIQKQLEKDIPIDIE